MIRGPVLIVDFCGEREELDVGEQLTFGRNGDLVIDTDRRLHRILGRFRCVARLWWIDNLGSSIPMTVVDLDNRSAVDIAPGTSSPVVFARAKLAFSVGENNFEIELYQDDAILQLPEPDDDLIDLTSPTILAADVPLTNDQRLLIVALAEQALSDPSPPMPVPASKAAAHRLGWSMSKFNRKLDNVCDKYTKAGVAGLKGDQGGLASDRRRRLVEHAVRQSIVDKEDLNLL